MKRIIEKIKDFILGTAWFWLTMTACILFNIIERNI